MEENFIKRNLKTPFKENDKILFNESTRKENIEGLGSYEKFMTLAYKEAKKALKNGDVPVGAIIVKNGEIISKAYNKKERRQGATYHAEVLAIERACKKLNSFRLDDCEMYVTLEPCMMCMGALLSARIKKLYVGVPDLNFGFAGGRFDGTSGFGGNIKVRLHILKDECKNLLDEFFMRLREKNKLKKLVGESANFRKIEDKFFINVNSKDIEVILLNKCQEDTDIHAFHNNDLQKYKIIGGIEILRSGKVILVAGDLLLSPEDIYKKVQNRFKGKTIKIFSLDKEIKIYNL